MSKKYILFLIGISCFMLLVLLRSRQKDLGIVKFIKDEGRRVLLRQEDIKMRWHQYFSQLLNKTRGLKEEIRQTSNIQRTQDHRSIIDITTTEVGEGLKKRGNQRQLDLKTIQLRCGGV